MRVLQVWKVSDTLAAEGLTPEAAEALAELQAYRNEEQVTTHCDRVAVLSAAGWL